MTLPPTAFTALVGCRLPIQQAGMGGVTTPALAGAVAQEGALGMIAAAGLSADLVVAQVRAALDIAGDGARVGVNFLMPFLELYVVDAAAEVAAVVECFYGNPDRVVVERIHDGGAIAAWQVGSVDEARDAVDAGCDLIVVQGREAGGHVRGTRRLLPLLQEVRHLVDLPLVAAGGMSSGAAIAAALTAGADAVRIGTRLVATAEADVHPDYAAALIAAGTDETVLTEAFSLGWPNAPHRVLRQCVDGSDLEPTQRSPLPPTGGFDGDVATAALYAGESVGAVTAVVSAASVVKELMAELVATNG